MAIPTHQSRPSDEGSPPLGHVLRPRRRPVSWRSLLLGLIGVAFICGLTPYNNGVLNNTDLVGCLMPTGLLLYFIVIVMALNAPLLRWMPWWALSGPELALALGMTLVSCSLPWAGLMRYLPGNLIGYWNCASADASCREVMARANLPDWMFPTFHNNPPPHATLAQLEQTAALRGNEPVVQNYIGRVANVPNTLAAHWHAVPWALWRTPAITWGILLFGVFGAILCVMAITRRQWVENERLPFPIASIYVAMIEPPDEGKAFNSLFSNRMFWIAFCLVFAIDGLYGLHFYDIKHFPEIPLNFNLSDDMTGTAFRNVDARFESQTIYFTVIGLTFFVQTRTAFSMWAFFVGLQVVRMALPTGRELTDNMQTDQFFGAVVPYAIAILWVGRQHFSSVFKQMFRPPRGNEPRGKYLPYWAAAWGMVLCMGIVVGWLVAAGASVFGAVVIVAMIMMLFVVVAKLVAETGFLYLFGLPRILLRPWVYLANDVPAAFQYHASIQTYLLSSIFSGPVTYDDRQRLPAYASHAFRVSDALEEPEARPKRYGVFFALVLALLAGYFISGAATLYTEYEYASTLDRSQSTPLNMWGVYVMPRWFILQPVTDWIPPKTGGAEPQTRLGHFALGAALTTGLSVLRLRYDWWPLHPVGYLLVYTIGLRCVWFSIFLGWLCKVVTLRLGGASLYRRLREFFIGLILGEAGAVAFWLIVALVRAGLGESYTSIQILPA